MLKRHKYLLVAAIALSALIYADFLTYGQFRISFFTIVFGLVVVLVQIARHYTRPKDKTHS